MNIFQINNNYKIVISISGKILTFTGKIIFEDDSFIKFIDKFGDEQGYSKNVLISWRNLNE